MVRRAVGYRAILGAARVCRIPRWPTTSNSWFCSTAGTRGTWGGLTVRRARRSVAKGSGRKPRPEGVVVYWHVDDVPAAYDRLRSMGAKPHEAPRDFGAGFIGASVIDPFGNILGIMYNPHYLAAAGADQD